MLVQGKMQAHRLWFWYDRYAWTAFMPFLRFSVLRRYLLVLFWWPSTHVCRTSFYRTLFTQRYCHFIPKTSDLCAELVSTMTLGSKQPHSVIKRYGSC